MTTAAPVRLTEVRKPALDRAVAMRLAATEYDRFAAQLRTLTPDDWGRPTACSAWDVRAMVAHVIGMAEMSASPVEAIRQMRAVRKADGMFIDALTDLQMRKHVHRSSAELVVLTEKVGPKAAKGRRRTPGFIRGRAMAEQPIEPTGQITERWAMGYLVDVILTRDTWMHRSDIALAVGRDMVLTADHDGVIVADVAAEWAQRHGQPCSLTLTGPAGGSWTFGNGGTGGPSYELDAVEFCRILSGRGTGEGLLATPVPF
jgi:uncharacterized protein (TIGR03083 family)